MNRQQLLDQLQVLRDKLLASQQGGQGLARRISAIKQAMLDVQEQLDALPAE